MTKRTTEVKMTELNKQSLDSLQRASQKGRLTFGLDLGDQRSHYCILDSEGEVLMRSKVATRQDEIGRVLGAIPKMKVVMEVGTHSSWVSRKSKQAGHETIVANARNVKWISEAKDKTDRADPEKLARLGRTDVRLLSPIEHRGEEAQRGRMIVNARQALVEARTKLINTARGLVKPLGERIGKCESEAFGVSVAEKHLSKEMVEALKPLLECVEKLTNQIGVYDDKLKEMERNLPETKLLTQVYGVGTRVGVSYVLTIEDPKRFSNSRQVGPYLGMVSGQRQSGEQNPQLRISKQGDRSLRALLVQSAHCIMKTNAPDSDLKRWGMKQLGLDQSPIGGQKGKAGQVKSRSRKKKVIVAVARKLAVLLHHLWSTGEVYDPLYQAKKEQAARQARARRDAERPAA